MQLNSKQNYSTKLNESEWIDVFRSHTHRYTFTFLMRYNDIHIFLCDYVYKIEVSFKLFIFHSYQNVLLTYYNGSFWLFGITMKVRIVMSIEHQWLVLGSQFSVLFFCLLYSHPQPFVRLFSFWYNRFEIHRQRTHYTLTWISSRRKYSILTTLYGFHCVYWVYCFLFTHMKV